MSHGLHLSLRTCSFNKCEAKDRVIKATILIKHQVYKQFNELKPEFCHISASYGTVTGWGQDQSCSMVDMMQVVGWQNFYCSRSEMVEISKGS